MDAKALAKSKRAHTLHLNKKHHHHPASSKGASTKSSGDKGKGTVNVKPQNALPSNWDRYDLGSEGEQASTTEPSDSVLPKSKGADYAYLISEAKSQSLHSPSEFLDDDLMFLAEGFGSLLSAKGQSMLSWFQDDDLDLEDSKESTSFEVPFLSLNLDALAHQLSKTKLSERLFIQPEALPAELLDDEVLQANTQDKNDHPAPSSSLSKDSLTSSSVRNHGPNSIQDFHIQTSEEMEGKPSDTANAEADIDMLLNSFGEVEISKPLGIPISGNGSDKDGTKETDSKKVGATTSIDDDIDLLLEETSDQISIDDRPPLDRFKSTDEKTSSTLPGTSKSQLEDDFDSWLDTI